MNKIQTQVVAYTSATHSMIHIFELTYPALMVLIMTDFAQGKFTMGVIANIFALGWGVAAIPAGFLSDRIGSRRVILITLVGAALSAIGLALSPNIYVLGATMAILGLATGLYHPSGLSFISLVMKSPQLGFAYHGMAGNLGLALAPLMAGGMASLWNWRASYSVFAAVALLIAALVNFSPVPSRGLSTPTPLRPRGKPEPRLSRDTVITLALIFAAYTFFGFIYRGTMTFLPLYFTERVQLIMFNLNPAALAGSLVTLALLFGILGQYIGGHLARRVKAETLLVAHALLIFPPLLLMGVLWGGMLVAVACVFVLFYFMAQPVLNTLVASFAPAEFQGRAFGFAFFFSFGLGSFAASFGGYIAQRLGTQGVFLSMAGFSILLLVAGLALAYRSRKAPPWAFKLS